jgi:fumarate hydratase, class II
VVEKRQLWGAETEKALSNFPISGERVSSRVIHWLGRIKAESALVNAELGLLDEGVARRVAAAGRQVANGDVDDQFPIDVFQTGSGTSTHMNANEVIAALAGPDVHPNDHVNLCQSSNCVFPSAVHLAAVEAIVDDLLPSLDRLERSLAQKSAEFSEIVKAGRTHLMDAVPVTLGQEFAGYASQVRLGRTRASESIERLAQIPLGGSATGSGLNVHPEFAALVRERLRTTTGLPAGAPDDPFEATGARDAIVETSGALRTIAISLMKIANDIRLLASGPRAGLRELILPELQKGSSMMPGKVNPVVPEVVAQVAAQVVGNDATIAMAASHGHLELNAFVPVLARNLIQSIELLASSSTVFAEKCVDGILPDLEGCRKSAEMTLATATALSPHIGYEAAEAAVREALRTGRPLRDVCLEGGVDPSVVELALDTLAIARGGILKPGD